MLHFVFYFNLLSIATGYATIIHSAVYFFKYRKKVLLYYGIFLLSLLIIMMGFVIDLYEQLTGLSLEMLQLLCNAAGCFLCVVITPPFTVSLLGLAAKSWHKTVWVINILILSVVTILFFFKRDTPIIVILLQLQLFTTVGICIYSGLLMQSKLGSKVLKKALRFFYITSLAGVPIIIADAFVGVLPFLPFNLSLPIYFFVLCVESLIFSVIWLDQPPYCSLDTITDHFINKFSISSRESEVANSLLTGKSNKEIADQLFISPKTVENHFSSIYQKN